MSEPEATVVANEAQETIDDSLEGDKADENGQDHEQTTAPPTDTANEEGDAGTVAEPRIGGDGERRSAMTTPEVPVSNDDAPDGAERLDDEDDRPQARAAANTPVATEGNAETGPAGSTPWPHNVDDGPQPDGDVDGREPVEVNFLQRHPNASPQHEDEIPANENEPTGQGSLFDTEREGGVKPRAVISKVSPPFENFGGNHYATSTYSRKPLPLTINRAAIESSARNKLPLAEVKGKVVRLGRHTEASAQKIKKWYKGDTYVDKDSYSWRNMALFDDFQRHPYTPSGSVRTSFKK